ncbi:hypothetical protein BE04_24740 [Sorangium cellulosum]|uniref:DUF2169 domain-containing protein n=1 Tax=Sorangium cellulosum TaxID=56 RepID=A0A150P2Y2_SORCE|nr:hypothetical protein BE04_24740 [Sorangium cellulosum]
MLDVASTIRGKCLPVPMKSKEGRDVLVVLIKYTFLVSPAGAVELDSKGGEPPTLVDEYNDGNAGGGSIRKPSQLYDAKPGTDVILVGHAHPPLRGRTTHVDVRLRVGPVAKEIRAHGLRVWQAGALGGLSAGPARPISEPIPLVYELAWGGMDVSDPERPVAEPRNLVGRGVARDWKSLLGQPAAQLEDPANPIGSRSVAPACFGAIHRHWQPRVRFAGTYDERWMETRLPLPPSDFDERYHVSVPPDQWSAAPLRGDEPFEITGATIGGRWAFQLPRLALGVSSVTMGRRAEHRSQLDMILIDADVGRVELSFRAVVPLPRKFEMLDKLVVVEKTRVP